MKITHRGMEITGIPYFEKITIGTGGGVQLDDGDGEPVTVSRESLFVLRDALTEALQLQAKITGTPAPPRPTPRVFREGDSEPGPTEHCASPSHEQHCVHWYDDSGPCCWCSDDTSAGQSDDAPPRPAPRVFREGDMEPGPEVTAVIDSNNNRWTRRIDGWMDLGSAPPWPRTWSELVDERGSVTEVRHV